MSASTFHVERAAIYDPAWRYATTTSEQNGFRFPSLTATVPKELVHRASVAEVLLTNWQRVDEAHFTVTAQWPRSHSFFTPVAGGYYDPLICAETIRQIGSLLGHAEFGVPFGHHFLMWDLNLTVHPEHLQVRQTPASLDIEVTCTTISRRGGRLTGLGYEAVVRREGHVVAKGGGSYTCTSPSVYRRVRPAHTLEPGHRALPLTAPAAPQSVGRLSPTDVVLSPIGEPNRWQLRVDTLHPVLFDHWVDHVPGMVLLEAARQASAAALGRSSFLPLSISGDFKRYAELDVPCVIEAERLYADIPGAEEAVRVTGRQEGQVIYTAVVTAAAYGH
ncbi:MULTISPECIES: ScbA/BarX family gamma-butyrolactone biosynthesis protein [Streptomyces]|uniref:ScbA/BarX family gamma-butyrolactone biosynthesis protein n=1 Tax=Streptomyces TaxID=1883 RepID=UPI0021AFF02F|nr:MULTISPECIES: ScbA/BarX family gamma-butyrolactone biosynthesis protein [Streptomyces]GLX23118.1 adhesin [Streptomyces lavendulae subsp. lavendulae]GLX30580.1 adhesin [Streptomyces lavendulae subsp. lavendulae]